MQNNESYPASRGSSSSSSSSATMHPSSAHSSSSTSDVRPLTLTEKHHKLKLFVRLCQARNALYIAKAVGDSDCVDAIKEVEDQLRRTLVELVECVFRNVHQMLNNAVIKLGGETGMKGNARFKCRQSAVESLTEASKLIQSEIAGCTFGGPASPPFLAELRQKHAGAVVVEHFITGINKVILDLQSRRDMGLNIKNDQIQKIYKHLRKWVISAKYVGSESILTGLRGVLTEATQALASSKCGLSPHPVHLHLIDTLEMLRNVPWVDAEDSIQASTPHHLMLGNRMAEAIVGIVGKFAAEINRENTPPCGSEAIPGLDNEKVVLILSALVNQVDSLPLLSGDLETTLKDLDASVYKLIETKPDDLKLTLKCIVGAFNEIITMDGVVIKAAWSDEEQLHFNFVLKELELNEDPNVVRLCFSLGNLKPIYPEILLSNLGEILRFDVNSLFSESAVIPWAFSRASAPAYKTCECLFHIVLVYEQLHKAIFNAQTEKPALKVQLSSYLSKLESLFQLSARYVMPVEEFAKKLGALGTQLGKMDGGCPGVVVSTIENVQNYIGPAINILKTKSILTNEVQTVVEYVGRMKAIRENAPSFWGAVFDGGSRPAMNALLRYFSGIAAPSSFTERVFNFAEIDREIEGIFATAKFDPEQRRRSPKSDSTSHLLIEIYDHYKALCKKHLSDFKAPDIACSL